MSNEIGHGGLWKSPTGLHIVVETKTSDVYAIKCTSTGSRSASLAHPIKDYQPPSLSDKKMGHGFYHTQPSIRQKIEFRPLNRVECHQPHEHSVPQVIGNGPFKAIDRRDQLWFQPAALLHRRGRQAVAALTATRLGQVLEGATLDLKPAELLAYELPQRRRETTSDSGNLHGKDSATDN